MFISLRRLTINRTANGEPVDIGRKSRIWPNAMARAIRERDQHCVWPGCTQSHHLHIHHIRHWADGGTTSVLNGASLCSSHHTLVHEGGYTIQRVEDNDPRLHEQFVQQQHAADISQFDVEKGLRNERNSSTTCAHFHPSVTASALSILTARTFTTGQAQTSVIMEPGRHSGSMTIHV